MLRVERSVVIRMRVAVTYEDKTVFQHFGHTAQFKVYDIEDQKIIKEQVIDTGESGHGALAGFLADNNIDVVICGGIGGGAQRALKEANIQFYGGVSGNADDAVRALLTGTLSYDSDVHCDHHTHNHHTCQNHCGEQKQGCLGNGGTL